MPHILNRRQFLNRAAGTLALAGFSGSPLAQSENKNPIMKTLLWCWDARMTWDDEPAKVSTKMATSDRAFPYPKQAESYSIGFRRLIHYCAAIGVEGVIIWGFLRDSHGGVETARDLCKFARDRGVAILPGVGLCSYGGFYFDGDHPYNLQRYLSEHPDRKSHARDSSGKRDYYPVLDPSLEANRKWWREGLEWMLETFEIGGIDFEMGDFLVNPSAEATKERRLLGLDCDENILDSILATRGLFPRALEILPDGIFINSTYRGFQEIKGFPKTDYIRALPREIVWQYTLRGMVRDPGFPTRFRKVPSHRMYGYLHWFNASTGTSERDFSGDIARIFPSLHSLGFDFAGTYGEISALGNPIADRNYRSQVEWS